MEWALTDRMNRVWMWVCVVLATAGILPILWDRFSIPLMVVVGMLVVQVWYLSSTRTVRVSVDGSGITKWLGNQSWTARWEDITSARLQSCLGSTQLVLETTEQLADWSISNKLLGLGRVPANGQAVQVDPARLDALRQALAEHGVALFLTPLPRRSSRLRRFGH